MQVGSIKFWMGASHRLLELIGNVPPAEAEDQYLDAADNIDTAT